jgi:hypothetical protein
MGDKTVDVQAFRGANLPGSPAKVHEIRRLCSGCQDSVVNDHEAWWD